jgi:aldehyde dehydrogenase (NAD+)
MIAAMSTPATPLTTQGLQGRARRSVERCGVDLTARGDRVVSARTPITGEPLFSIEAAGPAAVEAAISKASTAFATWRTVPAPVRGRVVKRLSALLEEHRDALADLITIEVGKIPSEANGEVQEMIDICDLAVGLSRQLGGGTMPSERAGHRLMETWHPLGVVGVITAFNFPAAVWSWNVALALVCGDTVVWKPSTLTPLTAAACSALLDRAAEECGAPEGLNVLVVADRTAAEVLTDSHHVPLISATGSERMGAQLAPRVAARFGRTLLELGGNNAAVVTPSADLELATDAIAFAAAGTAGQRCTTMRRLIVHRAVADELIAGIANVFEGLVIGDPFADGTLVGPIIDRGAFETMGAALQQAATEGGDLVVGGGRRETNGCPNGYYVEPALVRMPAQTSVVQTETFAPLLYVMIYDDFAEAVALHNGVPQGLSSSIFTRDQREAERFMAADGSDCGIVNVNIGTSGAEIGGAFGGEKTTGGGREAGSDAWRAYMRRATNTINYSDDLELAQGVSFG